MRPVPSGDHGAGITQPGDHFLADHLTWKTKLQTFICSGNAFKRLETLNNSSFQIFYIAMVVKSAVDIDADKNFQAELTDLNLDCATTGNADTWWCKAVTSMLVDGD